MSKLTKKQEKKRQSRQRERANKDPATLAYYGNKYRTPSLARSLMRIETAIFEAYVATDRQLTDHDVRQALVTLIEGLRHGALLAPDASRPDKVVADGPSDLVVQFVRMRWETLAGGGSHPGRDSLIGIARTILASVETRKSVNHQSRNYLQFIEEFLGKLGVEVVRVPASNAIDDQPNDDRGGFLP